MCSAAGVKHSCNGCWSGCALVCSYNQNAQPVIAATRSSIPRISCAGRVNPSQHVPAPLPSCCRQPLDLALLQDKAVRLGALHTSTTPRGNITSNAESDDVTAKAAIMALEALLPQGNGRCSCWLSQAESAQVTIPEALNCLKP